MFIKGFNATIKNLVRSRTFWLCMILFVLLVGWRLSKPSFGYTDMETYESIVDTDPRFVLTAHSYYKLMGNVPNMFTTYLFPLVMVFFTAIVINRDYGDRFFEIEKAGGIRPTVYLLSRIAALTALGFALMLIASFAYVHGYVITRGGVVDMGIWEYIADSTVRTLRMCVFKGFPCTVFFIGVTYCVGAIFKNGIAAAIIPTIYTLAVYFIDLRTPANDGLLLETLSHYPTNVTRFFYFYKVPGEDQQFWCDFYNISWTDVFISIGFLTGIAVLGCIISYLRVRKRNI